MDFRILGPVEAHRDRRRLALGGPKQRALLALLLLNRNQAVSADRLIDELWGERPPEDARNSLQALVSRLRRALGDVKGASRSPRIVTRPSGYVLRVEPGELDLDRFEQLRAEAQEALTAGEPAAAAGALRSGLALWRGRPLSDIAFEPFAQPAIGRLEELRMTAVEERVEADLSVGRHAELVGELEALVSELPVRERLRGQLMLALYRSGRQAEALAVYRHGHRLLADQLGLEPSPSLRELEAAILRQDPSLQPGARPSPELPEPGLGKAAPQAGEGIFVGRGRELALLLEAFQAALNGRGGLVLLSGEPGIGKSRLADELTARAARHDVRVLVGRCWEAGGAPAYWPWLQALRAYVGAVDPEMLRRELGRGAPVLAQILPELRQLIPDLPPPPQIDPDGARLRLFGAVLAMLRGAAAERPLLLVVDDLHAADEPSLLLLRFIAAELAEAPILVVGAYRDVDPTPVEPLSIAVADLARRPVTRLVRLGGLATDDVASFIRMSSGREPSESLVSAVHQQTEGNPLFVAELVRLLAEDGRLEDSELLGVRMSQGVEAVIGRRLRGLSEECTGLLRLASILGREFSLDVLARLSELEEEQRLEALDEAFEARVVEAVPGYGGRLRFSHALIRDALYQALSPPRRARLHRRAGEALEDFYAGNLEPHLAELAHHFALAEAENLEKAGGYARRAGERAAELLGYEEAARLFGVALHVLESSGGDDSTRCELMLSLGEAWARAGEGEMAKRTFLAAARLARRLGAAEQLARAALGYGGRFVWARAGSDKRIVTLLEDALRVLPEADTALRARALARLAGALRDQRSRELRDSLSQQAVAMARRLGDAATLAYALDGRFAAIMGPENPEERLSVAEELRRLAEAVGDRERTAQARYYRSAMTLLELGDVEAVEDELDVIETIAEELRQPAQRWLVAATRATLALFRGRFQDAEGLMERALTLGRLAQSSDAVLSHRVQLFTLRWQVGQLDGLETLLDEAIQEYPARPMFRCMLVRLHAEEERESDARSLFDELAADRFAALPLTNEWLFSMGMLADVAGWLGDPQRGEEIHELLSPYADRNACTADYICTGSVSRALGIAAATASRGQAAVHHFEAALAMNTRMGARPWVARTQLDYAEALLARDDAGDRANAEHLLAVSLGTFSQLGMERCARRASALESHPRRAG